MKKQLLLLLSSTMMLASCGGSVDPLKEPETKQNLDRAQMVTHVAKLGENLAKVEAFGVDTKASFDSKFSFGTPENKEYGIPATKYDIAFSLSECKESFAVKKVGDSVALSASASTKYSYDITLPSYSQGEDGKTKVESKNVKDSGSFGISAYILEDEPNQLYADLSGMKDAATKLLSAFGGSASTDQLGQIFGKIVVTIDSSITQVLANLPSYAGAAIGTLLGSDAWKEIVSSAKEDKNVYKEYTDGSYGIVSTLDFKDVYDEAASLIPSDQEGMSGVTSMLSGLAENLKGQASTLLIFTEDAVKTIGASVSAKLENSTLSGMKDVNASVNAEVRADIKSGTDVKVDVVSDKTAYKPVSTKAE